MYRRIISLVVVLAFVGCTTAPIPPNYSGPISTIRDTAVSETANRAQFYFLSEIDGKQVDNVLFATRKANNGRGFALSTIPFARDVPSKALSIKLEGRIGYGTPIQEILNSGTVYTTERIINFTPESNKAYVVRGILTAEKKEVWLEDAGSGERIK